MSCVIVTVCLVLDDILLGGGWNFKHETRKGALYLTRYIFENNT